MLINSVAQYMYIYLYVNGEVAPHECRTAIAILTKELRSIFLVRPKDRDPVKTLVRSLFDPYIELHVHPRHGPPIHNIDCGSKDCYVAHDS